MINMTNAQLKSLDQQFIIQTYNRYPIMLVKGEGVKVWDADGKEYLDFLSGIAVHPLGHCHPAVVKAIVEQAQTLMHVSNLYYTQPCVELAQLLVENGGLDKIFFCNSGAEANEAAIKLARKYHWRQNRQHKFNIVAAQHSFHGRTLATLAATGKPEIRQGFGPLPSGFSLIEFNDIEALRAAINEDTAAVLLEPVQGEGGINPAQIEFLQTARELCNQFNAVLIFDEIQCGLGRTGSFFAYQSYNVKPDLITLAKGMANGLPIGALCATRELAEGFKFGDHGTTFGGNPVATAAAVATIKTLLQENYCQRVQHISEYLFQGLYQLHSQYPQKIATVRGKGLMAGIELLVDAAKVLNYCHEQGLLANIVAGNVLRLLPPYLIRQEDVNSAIKIIERAIINI